MITKEAMMRMNTKELIETFRISQVQKYVPGKGTIYENFINIRNRNGLDVSEISEVMKNRKQEIIDFLTAEREEEQRKYRERQAQIDAIPGLKEIKAAENEIYNWNILFRRSLESEYGAGLEAGPMPQYDIKAMREQYPIADAYLKAEAEANKTNYRLSAIGEKALEAIIENPAGYKETLELMESEIKAFTDEHIWD